MDFNIIKGLSQSPLESKYTQLIQWILHKILSAP